MVGTSRSGARDGSEADEQHAVAELRLEGLRGREREARLAGSARAGERDEPRALVPEERGDRRQLEPAADERRGRNRKRLRGAGRRCRGGEARLLPQDRPLELLERGARLEAELVGEDAARVAVDLERVGLPPAAVEGEHALLEEPLAVGMLGRERLELGDDGVVPAAGELGVESELERREPQLLEPLGLRCSAGFLRQPRQRGPAPERERRAELVCRVGGPAGLESRPAAVEGALEPVEVELLLADDGAVAASGRLDSLAADGAAQPVHVDLQRLQGRRRRRRSPDSVDELLGRDDPSAVDEEQGQQRALLRRAERGRAAVQQRLDRSEHVELRSHDPLSPPQPDLKRHLRGCQRQPCERPTNRRQA